MPRSTSRIQHSRAHHKYFELFVRMLSISIRLWLAIRHKYIYSQESIWVDPDIGNWDKHQCEVLLPNKVANGVHTRNESRSFL